MGCKDARRTGYGIKNNGVVSSLRTDVNKNNARIINIRQDFDDSFAGVQTSIGNLRDKMQAAIHTLKTMIEANGHPVNSTAASGSVSVADNSATGVGIHPPTVPEEGPHAATGALRPDEANKTPRVPMTNRFHMADGYCSGFRSLSFPSGNQSPHNNWATGCVCLDNSSPNDSMEGALGGIPFDASNTSSPPCMGGHIESPCPSNKERLARARQTSLYNIAGLASDAYHGGPYGVQTLSERFIHNCG